MSKNTRKILWNYWAKTIKKIPLLTPKDNKHGLDLFHERDDETNKLSTPPDDEKIDQRCVWSVEFYTPSYAKNLLNSFSKLGWDKEEELINRSPSPWVKNNRGSANSGSWLNLGILTREGSGFNARTERVIDLPDEVDHAIAGLHNISPSITCLLVCFVLKESASTSYDRELRKTRKTIIERKGQKSYQYKLPDQQKAESIKKIRKGLRIEIGNWFSKHFPGQFSSNLALHNWPLCEFITLRNNQPFPMQEEVDGDATRWLSALGVQSSSRAWECAGKEGLRFQMDDSYFAKTGSVNHYILASKEDSIKPLEPNNIGTGRTFEIHILNMDLHSMIANTMLIPFLNSIGNALSEKRDSISADLGETKATLEFLEKAGKQISASIDTVNISTELIELTRKGNSIFWLSPDMSFLGPGNAPPYAESLMHDIRERSLWIKGMEKTLRDNYSQLSETISAHENIRLQKQIRFLTRATVVLSIITLISAFAR